MQLHPLVEFLLSALGVVLTAVLLIYFIKTPPPFPGEPSILRTIGIWIVAIFAIIAILYLSPFM